MATVVSPDSPPVEWSDAVEAECRWLAGRAVLEELGGQIDLTTAALVAPAARGAAEVVAREAGIAAGLRCVPVILSETGGDAAWTADLADGDAVAAGDRLGRLSGRTQDLLIAERIVLNFISHLSGIATLTQRFVAAVGSYPARIYDTRKTLPGWRLLEKYAVRCGGGHNHRMGLHDAVLIKDNHLAQAGWRPSVAVTAARDFLRRENRACRFIEVEVDSLAGLHDALTVSPDMILLDNMTIAQLAQAVQCRNAAGKAVQLEASGGVRLDSIAAIAATGVERISVGALTHSARALDVGLDWSWDDQGRQ